MNNYVQLMDELDENFNNKNDLRKLKYRIIMEKKKIERLSEADRQVLKKKLQDHYRKRYKNNNLKIIPTINKHKKSNQFATNFKKNPSKIKYLFFLIPILFSFYFLKWKAVV